VLDANLVQALKFVVMMVFLKDDVWMMLHNKTQTHPYYLHLPGIVQTI
jgi:hypothetical protein